MNFFRISNRPLVLATLKFSLEPFLPNILQNGFNSTEGARQEEQELGQTRPSSWVSLNIMDFSFVFKSNLLPQVYRKYINI
jgi:hypothetical protein